jgi:uncharacterized membrane protein YGL010W
MVTLTADTPSHRTIDTLFDRYASHHRHPTNKTIHWICVPAITWTVLALLWALHPIAALAFAAASLGYYFKLSPPLALGMLVVSSAMLAVCTVVPNLAYTALAVFVVAWIGQFVGHKIEGSKPSFFEDLHYLLIGPAWLMSFVYSKFGIRY